MPGGEVRRGTAAVVLLVSAVVVLAGVELATRALLPDRYYVWPPNFEAAFAVDPNVIGGVSTSGRLTINAIGMRGDPPPSGERHRILAVGGSTTICAYLDDTLVWTRLLQERLNAEIGRDVVWVGNAGRPGHATPQHVLQVDKLLAQHPEIDLVVLLIGINDFLVALPREGPPIPARIDPDLALARAFSVVPALGADTPWYLRNFLWRILRPKQGPAPVASDLRMDERGSLVRRLRRYRRNAGSIRNDLPDLGKAVAAYRARVDRIIDLAHAADVRVLLLTQPTLWRAGLDPAELDLLWTGGPPLNTLHDGAAYYSVDALAKGMRRFNTALLETCRARNVDCLDAAEQMPRDSTMFYDDAHFTELGSARLAQLVADHLRAEALLDAPRS